MNSDDWNVRYRDARVDSGSLWSATPPKIIRDTLATLSPGTALDLATGDGRTAVWLAQQGWKTTGVDFSAEALLTAQERARRNNVDQIHWVCADARNWTPETTFDVVIVAYLHLPRMENAELLHRAAHWVAPGGTLIVLGHDVSNIAAGGHGPRNVDVLYSPELLRNNVQSTLTVARCEMLHRNPTDDPESADDTRLSVDTILIAYSPLSTISSHSQPS